MNIKREEGALTMTINFKKDVIERVQRIAMRNIGVVCPNCGICHRLGDLTIKAEYNLLKNIDEDVDLIQPRISALLPTDPKTYDQPYLAVRVRCYNCKSRMLMVPDHLAEMSSAFNSYKLFTAGEYFTYRPATPVNVTTRKLFFVDINFVLTLLMDRAERENINLDPVPNCPIDKQGIPMVWEFDVSATKDQTFAPLSKLQIDRNGPANTGCIQYIEPKETITKAMHAALTEEFMDAMRIILELVNDWKEACVELEHCWILDTRAYTNDKFRDFYRTEYLKLIEEDVTAVQRFKWLVPGQELQYPAMEAIDDE